MKHVVENAFMKVRAFLLTLMIYFSVIYAYGQADIPLGTWRTHFSYNDVFQVATTDDQQVYAATANAIFYFDLQDNSLNKITKVDGISDAGVSSLRYDAVTATLSIGYSSGIIDFVNGNELRVFDDLAFAPQLDDRTIRDVEFAGDRFYIATGLGVVVLDAAYEILESYAAYEILETYLEIGQVSALIHHIKPASVIMKELITDFESAQKKMVQGEW